VNAAVAAPLRRAVRAGGFVGITAAMLPPFMLRLARAPEGDRMGVRDRWVRRWSDALLRLFAITVDAYIPGRRAPDRGRLVVANHRAAIDVAVLLGMFGGRMVSRADLSGWPVVGAAAKAVGTIFVDRESALSGAHTIRTIRSALEAGDTVCLFPEGTTFEGDVVRPFHAGAFISALRTRAEIVPVGIAYERGSEAAFVGESFVQHLTRMAGAKPTRVGKRTRAADLCARAHAAVQALVTEARALADAGGPG